ncbi:MAG: HTH domain-containing protein [Haloarculaceae archaeon]
MTDMPTPQIELYVRSLLPDGAHERQEDVVDRLQRLDREGRIENFSVIVWGKQVSRESAAAHTEEGQYILNRVAEFKQWALSNNVSLESFYQTVDVASEVTDESYTAITLPVMGLAEYRDGELTHVAPCTKGETVHSIIDRLERLENGEPSAIEEEASAARVV